MLKTWGRNAPVFSSVFASESFQPSQDGGAGGEFSLAATRIACAS